MSLRASGFAFFDSPVGRSGFTKTPPTPGRGFDDLGEYVLLPTANLNEAFDLFSVTGCKAGSAAVFDGLEGVPSSLVLGLIPPLGKLFGVYELTALLAGDVLLGVTLSGGGNMGGRFTGDVIRGAIVGKPGRCPWLVLGLGRPSEESGREGLRSGLSEGKKLDLLRRGDGEGGIWDNVWIVRSDKDGRGRRRSWIVSVGATEMS